MKKIKAGIIGCGTISGVYMENLSDKFDCIELVACADLMYDRAIEKAEEFKIKALKIDELLSNEEIEIVVNLTIPGVHAKVSLEALDSGKNVYVEKPLAVTREDGKKVLKRADEKGLLVGSAPDTFLGGGIQTCRKLIDDGWIGTPTAATAFMMKQGPEKWHNDPEFFYKAGGGPMFDMGPYYLSALISLLGPVKNVQGSTKITYDKRIIGSGPKKGQLIDVEVPTHIAGIMTFEDGTMCTMITSFDVCSHTLSPIEIHGTEGSMLVPNPNAFGGPVSVRRKNMKEWMQMPLTHQFEGNSRGIGVADMAKAIIDKREHRANGRLAYHVLDIMHAFHDSSDSGKTILLESTCEKPAAFSLNTRDGNID